MRILPMVGLLALQLAARHASAQPKGWVYQGDEAADRAAGPVRFSTRLNFWVSNFDRPPRACRTLPVAGPGPRVSALRSTQFPVPGFACNAEDSDEVAFGSGIEFAFKTLSFLYLTAGVDFVYTSPSGSLLKNQLVVALPFGVKLTYYPWVVRPIAYFELTPVLYLTDDSRDWTFGGGGGIAYRILSAGSISFTFGYHLADTLKNWQLQLSFAPLF